MSDDFAAAIAALNTIAVELDTSGPRVARRADVIVVKTAHDIEGYSKQIAPVDTGAMRSSIGTDITRHASGPGYGVSAEIGPTVEYAGYVEYGTERQAPQAFMGPSLDRYSPGFIAALLDAADPLDGQR